jgi:hypothetical protein
LYQNLFWCAPFAVACWIQQKENCGGSTLSQFTSTQNHSFAIGVDEDGISTFSGLLDIGPRGVHDLAQENAHNVTKVKNKSEKKIMLGIMVKLNEAAKGNFDRCDNDAGGVIR